jgi:predicted Rossmann fold flavoprotein
MNNFDVIVIGSGPAGMLAAGRAAELGGEVLILEKMRQEARKLMITGKGRCNITNDKPIDEFTKYVYPQGRFLRNAFHAYYSQDILALLQKYGVEVSLSRGGRYFPTSYKAMDVVNAILQYIRDLKVEVRCGHRVEKLFVEDSIIKGVVANGEVFFAPKVILATGGKSYPATGSNGEGYEMARQVGHTVVKPRPSLVAIETEGDTAQKLEGLNLKNVMATIWVNGKKIGGQFGEMAFKHFGVGGPIIITLSRKIVDALHQKNVVDLQVDLKPTLSDQKLDNRLMRELNQNGRKKVEAIFKALLPQKMIPVFIDLLGIDPEKLCHQVTSKERKQILRLLKNFSFKISRHRSFKEAIITAGGIPTKEISQKTMESKIVSGLYFAGEIIDVDAKTGGFNLQIAYSTGWLAGDSCMKRQNILSR